MVFAPHPDDEVLGCGGTIARYVSEREQVYLCIVTKVYTPDWSEDYLIEKAKEIVQSNKVLGIHKTFFLDYPAVKLDTISKMELNQVISDLIKKINPSIVIIPHKGDLNFDHGIVHDACLVGTRPLSNKIQKILSYETLSETEWNFGAAPFIPNVYVDIEKFIDKKLSAMSAYKSELRSSPHPRSLDALKILAQKRGFESGLKFAEAFMVIRETIY